MTNAEIARVFSRIASLLELDDANPFRIRAYREAARIIESQGEPVEAMAAREKALESIRGIGKDIAGKIRDVVATGSTSIYAEMLEKYPLTVVALTELQGLGPKRVKLLFEKLQIRDSAGLEAAARAGKLRDLPGFGEKIEQRVLQSIANASDWSGRILLAGAWDVAHRLAESIRAVPGVARVENAGSFRRRRETVGDLDLLVCGGDAAAVMQTFVTHSLVVEVLGRGETKSSVRLGSGLQVDLRLVPEASFGAAMLYFTGSKQHNIELRKVALDQGMSLNEYGLTRDGAVVAGRTEEDVYRALGMDWIPPELREAQGEIDLARAHRLPVLLEEQDLVADLHMHTDRSDGRNTIEEMVRAARQRGCRYCAITEHSQSLAMARGFDDARVRTSRDEIEAVRRKFDDIQILHGLEVDILADGALDLGEEGLAMLDWVIVSLHSRLDQPAEVATARVLKAIEHPMVCAMGHPSARMIGKRPPVPLDFERIFARAAELGVVMEINAQPDRLDLSDVNARLAKARGVRLILDTDAHRIEELRDFPKFGVFMARRAGLTRDDLLNTLPFERFRETIRKSQKASPAAKPRPAAKPQPGVKPDPATRRTARAAPAARVVSKRVAKAAAKRVAKVAAKSARQAKPPARPAKAPSRKRG